MEDVGVRELRQNLSRYLRRVSAGETLRVCERGRPVATLAPLPDGAGPFEQLVAAGRVRRASLDLVELGPPAGYQVDLSMTEALEDQRSEG